MIFPTVNASSQTIWQSKVAPDLQGRVFSVRLMLAQMGTPLAMVLAGPLADRVFEPGMRPGGGLASTFGSLVGTGPGAGMALMLVFAGLLAAIAALIGYVYRPLRDVETTLPDHDAPTTESSAEPAVEGAKL
jgi:DHA3 family macrolide efflux protein-like MFS transporter